MHFRSVVAKAIDDGPNEGFKYFDQHVPFSLWDFYWDRHPELDSRGAFYQAQCGDYPDNLNGYISGSDLSDVVEKHEATDPLYSHYFHYLNAVSQYDFDAAWDAAYAAPTVSTMDFESEKYREVLDPDVPSSMASGFVSSYNGVGDPPYLAHSVPLRLSWEGQHLHRRRLCRMLT